MTENVFHTGLAALLIDDRCAAFRMDLARAALPFAILTSTFGSNLCAGNPKPQATKGSVKHLTLPSQYSN